jgi:hypothetical protein
MKSVAVLTLLVAGCGSIFGLEAPELVVALDSRAPDVSEIRDGAIGDVLPDGAPVNGCPASYTIAIGTSRYRRITTAMEWLPAAQQCAADMTLGTKRTHLVVIADDNERASIATMMSGLETLWIGLTDRISEGSYRWVTAEPINGYPPAAGSPPWSQGEPDNALGQDCVLLSSGLMADVNCGAGTTALCECDAYADDPSRYGP